VQEVKLQMTPPSNIKALSINMVPDVNFAQEVIGFVKVG
jgi:hypothetical protein